MRIFKCIRPNNIKPNIVIVALMKSRQDDKYHFVNLTSDHICECGFDTIEQGIEDMEKLKKEGKLLEYINYGEIQLNNYKVYGYQEEK